MHTGPVTGLDKGGRKLHEKEWEFLQGAGTVRGVKQGD